MTTDGKTVRMFMSDGRKKKAYAPEEPMDHISYCSNFKQFVGRMTGGDELFVSFCSPFWFLIHFLSLMKANKPKHLVKIKQHF